MARCGYGRARRVGIGRARRWAGQTRRDWRDAMMGGPGARGFAGCGAPRGECRPAGLSRLKAMGRGPGLPGPQLASRGTFLTAARDRASDAAGRAVARGSLSHRMLRGSGRAAAIVVHVWLKVDLDSRFRQIRRACILQQSCPVGTRTSYRVLNVLNKTTGSGGVRRKL